MAPKRKSKFLTACCSTNRVRSGSCGHDVRTSGTQNTLDVNAGRLPGSEICRTNLKLHRVGASSRVCLGSALQTATRLVCSFFGKNAPTHDNRIGAPHQHHRRMSAYLKLRHDGRRGLVQQLRRFRMRIRFFWHVEVAYQRPSPHVRMKRGQSTHTRVGSVLEITWG